jgi:hypothetical protein
VPPAAQALTKKELPITLAPVPIAAGGTVLNTMQPVNRILGLYEGKTWRIPWIDPLEAVLASFPGLQQLSGPPRTHYLDAVVRADTLRWDNRDEDCWRIDYAEPGRKDSARTWVRRRDGLVLQQEARHDHLEMVLRRDPDRQRR